MAEVGSSAPAAASELQNGSAPKASEEGRPKRDRKQASFFQPEAPKTNEGVLVIKQGKGTKLGEIINVHYLLGKVKADDDLVTNLHHLLFKSKGTATQRKKHIFEYSGISAEADSEKEKGKLEDRLGKWSVDLLNRLLDTFELPRGSGEQGHKGSKIARLVEFLDAPHKTSDKDLAAEAEKKKQKAKKSKSKAKTPTSAGKKQKASTPASSGKKRKQAEEEEDDDDDDEEEEEEEPEPPKKKTKKEVKSTTPKKKAAEQKGKAKGTPKKSAEKPKAAKTTPKKAKKVAKEPEPEPEPEPEEEPEEEQEPVEEEEEGGPDKEELKAAVHEIMQGSDASMSMKQLMAHMQEKFPDSSLKSKKAFIKSVAIAILKSKQPEEGTEEGDAKEGKQEEGEGEGEGDNNCKDMEEDPKAEAEEGGDENEEKEPEGKEGEAAEEKVDE